MPSDGANETVESDLDVQIAECNKAISRNPQDAKAYRQRGLLGARLQRFDEALQDFERALKLAPDDPHVYGLRAIVWAKIGNHPRAMHDFDEAIRLAPQNAELYRSHRDRVIAETSHVGPIAGGDFNILKNPFILLGLPPTAAPAVVKEAYEDAVEDDIEAADILRRAQQILLTPRLRIEAEVGGFLDVDPRLAVQIVSDIRSGVPFDNIGERLNKLHSLPRSNVIAHYGSAKALELEGFCDLIDAQAAVVPGTVCDAINDVREEANLGCVDREAITDALTKLLDRQTKAVVEGLGLSEHATDLFDRFVARVTVDADSPTLFRLDVYIRMFSQMIAPELSKRAEAVASICEEVRARPKAENPRDKLVTALRSWISLLRPIQTYETYRQREDAMTREMYAKVRNLALWLANDAKEFESAGRVVAITSEIFGHLPRAAAQIEQETAQLVELRNEQLADELLTPLLQACEEINNSHRTIVSELLRAKFGPRSAGHVRDLFDKFDHAVKATAKMPFSDAPWRLVRSVAISLNNDSSVPQAAKSLIDGLLDFAERNPPTAEMISVLREDQRVARKNQVEAELGKSVQAQKWSEAEKLVERLLTLETDGDSLRTFRELRDKISAKRKSVARTRWFWAAAAAGVVILIAASGDGRKSSPPVYQPPQSSYSPLSVQSNTPRQVVDTSETMPLVGTGLTLSRANIRYCSYQGVRLEAARAAITAEVQRQRFNAGIDDFNSRCSRYRYLQSDKDIVDAELLGKRFLLEAEGRSLAASWQPSSRPGSRPNR